MARDDKAKKYRSKGDKKQSDRRKQAFIKGKRPEFAKGKRPEKPQTTPAERSFNKSRYVEKPCPEGMDRCWGRHSVITLLQEAPGACNVIYMASGVEQSFREEILLAAGKANIKVRETEAITLDALTGREKHQGIVADMDLPEKVAIEDMGVDEGPAMIVVLDHLKDPHNLGAIVRSVEVVGGHGVVYPVNRSATVNGTVLKTSAGAAFRVPIAEVTNIVRTLRDLKKRDYWVVGLDHNAEKDIWSEPLPDRMVLVVGSEGEGISRLAGETCDELRSIPMSGKTGSLNASVAAAVGMFEWKRTNG